MAEFQEVIRQWQRMCIAKLRLGDCNIEGCPLYQNDACEAICDAAEEKPDYAEVERVVMAWSAEHPEPVYPTWLEWLKDVGLIIVSPSGSSCAFDFTSASDHIPADIAEKLGLEPKEGA